MTFPWVILVLWSLERAFSVLSGAETLTELVSLSVVLHCHSSSAESVQRQNMKALNTHRHTYTHSQNQSVSFWNTYICKHTLSIFIFLSQTYHIHKHSHTDTLKKSLWSYILFAVSGCAGCLWTYLHSVCTHACRESISVHIWSPKCGLYVDKLGLLSVYLREYIRKFLVSYK